MNTCNLDDMLTKAASATFSMPIGAAQTMIEQILQTAAAMGYAGSDYYLPSLQHMTRAERNAMIRSEFNGTNLRAVCRKFAVSKTTVYRACRRLE